MEEETFPKRLTYKAKAIQKTSHNLKSLSRNNMYHKVMLLRTELGVMQHARISSRGWSGVRGGGGGW